MERWLNATGGNYQQACRHGVQTSYIRIQSDHRISVAFYDEAVDLPLMIKTQKLGSVHNRERGIHMLEECSYEVMLVSLRR